MIIKAYIKSEIFKLIILGTLLLSGVALYAQSDIYPENLHIYPYLQYATPTSIIIKWETDNQVIGSVIYSKDDSFNQMVTESSPAKIHEVKLKGLIPATKYYYKVKYDNTVLETASFTTAPVPGTPNWRMVAYGDNRTFPETHKRIVAQILKLNPSMVIHSGDLVSNGNNYEEWKTEYFDPMKGLSENITVFPSLGNHERNSPHYYEYMSLPDENGESYYSFDYGNAHLIALNSNVMEAPFDLDSEQTQWLIQDLKKHADTEWKIVFFHHPLFRCQPTRGIEPQRWVWQDVFDEYGVDLVVNGHDHYYQRTYAIGNYQGKPSRGIYHIISGGGGANNYPIMPKVHAASRRSIHHITLLDFQGDRIVGRAIDDKGNVFDAFVIDKEAENSPEEFISFEIFKIERDLSEAIINLPLAELDKTVNIDQTLEIENPFTHPIQMSFYWMPSNNWTTNVPINSILQPGQTINIDFSANSEKNNIYPPPQAMLHFQTPEGKMAFKNNTIEFYPIKIGEKKKVKPLIVKKPPVIDGDISDTNWDKNDILDQFRDVQGDPPIQKTEIAVSMNKAKSKLYVVGKVEATAEYAGKGVTGRDNRFIRRDERVKIHIGVGEEVYTYIVNSKGTLLDTQDNTIFWNPDAIIWNSTAIAAAKTNQDGWQFEIEIPLDELKIANERTTINFSRRDIENNTEYEYSLTYGRSRFDHRVPMYDTDWFAVDRFAELVLK
jgi:hypothetical protein